MTTETEIVVIEVDPSQVIPIEVDPLPDGSAVEIPRQYGATRLDELFDVDGAANAFTGQVLARETDGIWRPTTPATGGGGGGAGPLSFFYEQTEPSTVWLVAHDLLFIPAAYEVVDHLGDRHFPRVSVPTSNTIQLDFDTPVRGTVRLS